jgi:TonB family protein
MFASDRDAKGVSLSFVFSAVLHVLILLLIIRVQQAKQKELADYKLTEIMMLEQVQDEKKPVEIEKPKKMFDILKQMIPIKQKMELAVEKPKALDLKKPEMNLAKPQALALDKNKMDSLKPALKLDLDNEIGAKKISPAMVQQQKLALDQERKLAAAPQKMNINMNASTAKNSFLPVARPAISTNARSAGGLKPAAVTVQPTPAPKKAAAEEKISIAPQKQTALLITGQLSGRSIMRKTSPQYPRWAEEQGIQAQVYIDFTVRADGSVKDSLIVSRTSGYPELDDLAKEALATFIFAPLSSSEDQTGTAVFVYKLSR